MLDAIAAYLKEVEREYKTGIAAEHAYRASLERLLEAVEDGLNAVNDPRRSDIGAPDFLVLREHTTIGFVEAKDIGISLDKVETSEQLQRYLKGFGNLILTDYLEFRWYVKGEHQQTTRIANAERRRIRPDRGQFADLEHMLRSFVQTVVPTVKSAQELAQRMAANAHLIRNLIFADLESDDPSPGLVAQRDSFARTLLPDIDNGQFADMYAQTIAYGLFAARVNYTGDPAQFSRRGAGDDIPRTNPFLRKLFVNIGLDLGDRVTFLVDVLADLLARTDMDDVLRDFGKATRQEDPVVHFYETFLREYDPKLREQRGVYYTPEPVVSYIVRSVDHILRDRFGRADGLADTSTLILDPATGTGTFLYFVMQQIREAFTGQEGAWHSYVQDHLLRRIFGFELLMAPYAVAHMKLGLLLDELGYTFGSEQRLGVYLTNTLEEAKKTSETVFAQFISEEANEAAAVKRDKPIMVVLGNPPYSGHSANKGEWIGQLVRDYYFVDGQPLGERNPKWLQDDYVKFIRFGQWRIEQTGHGILAFVTNHGYLDNPTFRGMRQQLMNAFTDIYIIDLHGNSKKKERTPDGGTDQNVFDIQQGVAIGVFVKGKGKTGPAQVHHVDVWGVRGEKYATLLKNGFDSMAWHTFEPQPPYYLFGPYDIDLWSEYVSGWKASDAIPKNVLGFQSHRDSVAIAFTKELLLEQVRDHLGNEPIADQWNQYAVEIDYRPFDRRVGYLSTQVTDRPRHNITDHLLLNNLALNLVRQTKMMSWQHSLMSRWPTPAVYVEIKDGSSMFPLYLYPEHKTDQLFSLDDDGSGWPLSDKGRRPNLNPAFVRDMAGKLGLEFITDGRGDLQTTFGPEDVFAYTYAVFHCPTYRERYAEFLKIDFPRLPLTSDADLFRVLVALGAELVDLHLMRSPALHKPMTTYPAGGSNEVAKGYPKYTEADQRVWINKAQYFEGVPPDVWEFYVGGYQVLDKWLKDRRGRVLSYEDIRHYQRVVVALHETIRLMGEIDDAIPAWPIS